MKRECLLVIGLAVASVASLKCYFCKSDYDSKITDEEENTKDIPRCGGEPYGGHKQHVVACDMYYDHFAMVNPTFKKALSSTTPGSGYYKAKKKRYGRQGERDPPNDDDVEDEDRTDTYETTPGHKDDTGVKTIQLKDVYPYNLLTTSWGSQRVHPRVTPYLCLTVRTVNSTFPNRVCGLRYFMDCQLLRELTSEPLQPSTFVTSCHQCDKDYCNAAAHQDLNGRGVNLLFISFAIYSFHVLAI